MKKKAVAALAFAVILMFAASSCSAISSTTMYNGYLGLSIKLPDKFTFEKYAEQNLTETAGESLFLEDLTIESDDYGNQFFGVVAVLNERPEDSMGIASGFVSAHITNDYADIKEYAYENYQSMYQTGEFDGYTITLADSGAISVNGIDYYKLCYEIKQYFDDGSFIFGNDIYVTECNGSFVTVEIQYYGDDPVSTDFARTFLKTIYKV